MLTEAAWDPQALAQQRVPAWVAQRPPHGRRRLDDTGLPNHGRRAVGVARPYAGTLGQVAHGQGVVSAHSVADAPPSSPPVPWPLTAPLSLPETWAAAQARRATGRVPTDGTLQTKPERALALVDQARTWGVPLAPGVADAGDGDTPTCLQGLDDRQVAYGGGVRSPCGGRLPDEGHAGALRSPPPPRGRGQPQKPRPAPLSQATAVRAALPADRWHTLTWRERDAGVLRTQCVAVRAHGATGGAQGSPSQPRVCPGPEGWRLGERPGPGARGAVQGEDRNLPADTPLPRRGELAHRRWPLEPCYEDAQGAWGLDHDQGRRWDGRPRHRALGMLA